MLKNVISWSKSRDRCLQDCPRQYYYRYYGSWGGWEEQGDPVARELYILKNLRTRQMWAGEKVHRAVEQALLAVRSGMPPPGSEGLVERTLRAMRQDFRDSRAGRYRQDPKRYCGLVEHAYGVPMEDALWKETADGVAAAIRTFLGSPVYAGMRGVAGDRWLELETLRSLQLGGVDVYVKLDLAYREGAGAVIYDWKTGQGGGDEVALQFAVYALYAREAWKLPAEHVQAREFNLARDEVSEHPVSEAVVAAAHDYILESIGEMQGLLDDVDANTASEEAFPAAGEEAVCRRCVFRKVCPRWAGADPVE